MARKKAELFSFNRGVRLFYATCRFDELRRGSVLCLLNASFKTGDFTLPQLNFLRQNIDDHDVCHGDTGQILTQWRRPVASRVDLDLSY